MLWAMGIGDPPQAERAALTDLLSAGGLAYVRSAETRRLVARYERLLAVEEKEQEDLVAQWTRNIVPYLQEHGSLADMFQFGYEGERTSQRFFSSDSDAFVQNRKFSNLLTTEINQVGNYRRSVRNLLEGINELAISLAG